MSLSDLLAPTGVATPEVFSAADVAAVLTPSLAIEAIENYLREDPLPQTDRTITPVSAGELLMMPAQSADWVGIKLVTIAPQNPTFGRDRIQGSYLLMDAATLAPVAVMDAVVLTALRTAAVSALAAKYLAEDGDVVLFGTSTQAASHLLCLREVRQLGHVHVVGRDPDKAERFAAAGRESGLSVSVLKPPEVEQAVASAAIVCATTTSKEPLFDGRFLADGSLTIAMGNHLPHARELDGATLAGAYLVVEDYGPVWREYGEFIQARREGAIETDFLGCDLRQLVVSGGQPGNRPPGLRSVFKSVGSGWQDLAVVREVYQHMAGASKGGSGSEPAGPVGHGGGT